MWVARDKDGELWLFELKPERDIINWIRVTNCYKYKLQKILFPNLKWEDEPIEVELTVKKKEYE